MEINEALDAIQTLVHCQGISREIEALETIRAALVVVQNSSHNKPSAASCPQCGSELIVYQETYCSSSECGYAIDNGQPAHVG